MASTTSVLSAESRRANQIIAAIAGDAGVTPADLVETPYWPELLDHRLLAIVLCQRIFGIDCIRLSRIFGVNPDYPQGARDRLVLHLERDRVLRAHFVQLCRSLGERPPVAATSWVWPKQTIEGIWDAVADTIGLPGSRLLNPHQGHLFRYRWLAIDLCLRLPEMNISRISEGLGISRTSIRYGLTQLPVKVRTDAKLSGIDAAVSARFGLQPRLEWY